MKLDNLGPNPILYSFRRCPYAMRARLAIAASGQKVELREILLRDKPAELLLASHKATVPVLVEADGSVLEESLDIMLWALNKNDPQNWLHPKTVTLDEMLVLITQCEDEFKTHLDRYKYANRYDDVDGENERDIACKFLWQLNKQLTTTPYLYGDKITLADMAIFTFIRQFANVDRVWFDGQKWENLKTWLVGLLESERFAGVMVKYDQWNETDNIVVL